MATNCLLHNAFVCEKERTINRARTDGLVRIVHAFDWSSQSDNTVLIQDEVRHITEELENKQPLRFSFHALGAKDGSIYCDICRQIRSADIGIFDISTYNLNVILELGLAIGAGIYVFIVRSQHYPRKSGALSDLNGILEYRFSRRSGKLKFGADFSRSLRIKLRDSVNRRMKISPEGKIRGR